MMNFSPFFAFLILFYSVDAIDQEILSKFQNYDSLTISDFPERVSVSYCDSELRTQIKRAYIDFTCPNPTTLVGVYNVETDGKISEVKEFTTNYKDGKDCMIADSILGQTGPFNVCSYWYNGEVTFCWISKVDGSGSNIFTIEHRVSVTPSHKDLASCAQMIEDAVPGVKMSSLFEK